MKKKEEYTFAPQSLQIVCFVYAGLFFLVFSLLPNTMNIIPFEIISTSAFFLLIFSLVAWNKATTLHPFDCNHYRNELLLKIRHSKLSEKEFRSNILNPKMVEELIQLAKTNPQIHEFLKNNNLL